MPPILSCMGGTVVRAGWDPWGLGLHVRIDHGIGYETVYGHMSRLDVSYGENVKRGQIIGLMGSTGRSTGPHVHYMVKYNGIAQDPLNFTQ
jgi:murein DD-endopeptidase MepM/ murein hydrolase activator NlpD